MPPFDFFSKKPRNAQQKGLKTFILEPILTPSGLVDAGDDVPDLVDLTDVSDLLPDEEEFLTNEEGDVVNDDGLEVLDFFDPEDEGILASVEPETTFTSGYFTVGDEGIVSIDFLFDGGGYEGELAIFSLEGMDEFEPGSNEFIAEAASRAASDSELGHVVIADATDGARFDGELGESDKNSGVYRGVTEFEMKPGDEFGFMLVPNGTVEDVVDNPDIGGAKRPLFSMATANPEDAFHVGQIADVTGDGRTFVIEDLRVDGKSDGDYNDLIFRLEGATGQTALLDEVIDPADDWRDTELGKEIAANVVSHEPEGKELPGDAVHPVLPEPTVPQTDVDQGGDNFTEGGSSEDIEPNRGGALPDTPTEVRASTTEDVIDQVGSNDPTDFYQVSSSELVDTEISVLSGNAVVSILNTEGEVLSQQVMTRGTHTLTIPEDISGEVLLKLNSQDNGDTTYILKNFASQAEEPFNIDLEFASGLTASQQAIMQEAAKSVEGLISKGLPSAIVDGKIIDDINFKISVDNLDGEGGTQARTKIDFMRYGSLLPAQSLVQFDVSDLAELERTGELFSVVQHELLHGLGFGNLWEAKGLIDYAHTPLARYNGKKAVKEFKEAGGFTDNIPLETQGNGSAGLHWHEELFQDELMTADLGFQARADGQVVSPISNVTLASLADLGYQVNLKQSTPDWELWGGQQLKEEDLSKEQIKAFRRLTKKSFSKPGDEFIYAIMPEVDLDKVSPEIWAHAERFEENGEYYDWEPYQVQEGDTFGGLALRYLGNASYEYYKWIGDHNNAADYDYLFWDSNNPNNNWIEVPIHRPNYEQEREEERRRREEELQRKQEEEERRRREEEERLAREREEQERKRREEEERQREAERKRRELEEQERRLREEQERRRQEEERRKEEERLRELERQREIARQKGKGGYDWFFATPLPEFGSVDPFETKVTGETVGNLVPDDYYRFTLSRKGRITAELMKLLADADLVLYDVRNKPIAFSMREGITDERIVADLIPGTYMLRVNSPGGVTTDYDLIVKFKHQLSRTELGPPPGWRVGGNRSNGGSGGVSSPVFSDPRIKRIYDTAFKNFEAAERARANARIKKLEIKKRLYEQDLEALLNRLNAEQRAKVHGALDDIRHSGNIWADETANKLKRPIDGVADGIINQIDRKIPSQIRDLGFVRNAVDNIKGAINGARDWLKERVNWVQNQVKHYLWHFIEAIKNAYRTGAEINTVIENAARDMKHGIDGVVSSINNLVGEFKNKILGGLGWLSNVGAFGWNFYDGVAAPLANGFANGITGVVNAVGNFANKAVDWIKPRAQKTVAAVLDALLGDKTGHLYNKINRVDEQIEATRTNLERTIINAGNRIAGVVRQIEALLTDTEERKRVLDALFRRGYSTAEEAYNFVKAILPQIRIEIINDLVFSWKQEVPLTALPPILPIYTGALVYFIQPTKLTHEFLLKVGPHLGLELINGKTVNIAAENKLKNGAVQGVEIDSEGNVTFSFGGSRFKMKTSLNVKGDEVSISGATAIEALPIIDTSSTKVFLSGEQSLQIAGKVEHQYRLRPELIKAASFTLTQVQAALRYLYDQGIIAGGKLTDAAQGVWDYLSSPKFTDDLLRLGIASAVGIIAGLLVAGGITYFSGGTGAGLGLGLGGSVGFKTSAAVVALFVALGLLQEEPIS
ncbi:MAG: DUF4114 domain-containing protein [Spirulinaceae cyanobacterium]